MSPMFVPGPVDVAPEVLAAQAKPMMPHRSKDFEEIFRRTAEKAQKLFYHTVPRFSGYIFRFRYAGSRHAQFCAGTGSYPV